MSQDVCALSDITTQNFVRKNIVFCWQRMHEKPRKTFGFIRLHDISPARLKMALLQHAYHLHLKPLSFA
jgi:hypothetical protein